MEEIYIETIKKMKQKIKELEGYVDEEVILSPEFKDSKAKLTFDGTNLTIKYEAFDGTYELTLDPFKNHNVADFIAAAINYFRWDNALYDDNDYSEEIDLEDETIRYKNYRQHP